jgi:hypothetical protein
MQRGGKRGSAGCQMQKLSAGKFHGDDKLEHLPNTINVCFWHKADMTIGSIDVRFWG